MAAIVDRLKKQIVEQGGDTAGIQTISQALEALGGRRKGEDIAEAVDKSIVTVSKRPYTGGGYGGGGGGSTSA